MKQTPWFNRKFNFDSEQNIFPPIIERLGGTPLRMADKISNMSGNILSTRLEESWSIKENIGHLIDMEPLWIGRLEDILDGKEEMRPADLENKKTHVANHNASEIETLIKKFDVVRGQMMETLSILDDDDVFKYSLHPRLKTPMRIMDLFLFVAEHDDHHLATITQIHNRIVDIP